MQLICNSPCRLLFKSSVISGVDVKKWQPEVFHQIWGLVNHGKFPDKLAPLCWTSKWEIWSVGWRIDCLLLKGSSCSVVLCTSMWWLVIICDKQSIVLVFAWSLDVATLPLLWRDKQQGTKALKPPPCSPSISHGKQKRIRRLVSLLGLCQLICMSTKCRHVTSWPQMANIGTGNSL